MLTAPPPKADFDRHQLDPGNSKKTKLGARPPHHYWKGERHGDVHDNENDNRIVGI